MTVDWIPGIDSSVYRFLMQIYLTAPHIHNISNAGSNLDVKLLHRSQVDFLNFFDLQTP